MQGQVSVLVNQLLQDYATPPANSLDVAGYNVRLERLVNGVYQWQATQVVAFAAATQPVVFQGLQPGTYIARVRATAPIGPSALSLASAPAT